MVLPVCKYGEKILREKAVPVPLVDEKIRRLAADMIETMHTARGVGLAAEQVGRTERVCVIDMPAECDTEEDALFNAAIPMPLAMVNPEIISQSGAVCDKEGCLSFPGVGGAIVRADEITCQYIDLDGRPQIITVRGYLARAVQHEIDHLNGILYVDHMSAIERLKYAAKLKKLAKANGGIR